MFRKINSAEGIMDIGTEAFDFMDSDMEVLSINDLITYDNHVF